MKPIPAEQRKDRRTGKAEDYSPEKENTYEREPFRRGKAASLSEYSIFWEQHTGNPVKKAIFTQLFDISRKGS
ncbi:MAG: hypothetical protein IKS22_12130 [Bacteroidales bacterium]|nr:hypothetical protein [Bacteroidales bacterium]